MPARLPDEDLSPVEGAAPPSTAVAPTELGLNAAGEALGQAATVGYRAAAIATRAQAQADERSIAPTVTDMKGALNGVLGDAAGAYHGEPGFVPQMQAAGQKVVDSFKAQRDAMTPGQQSQFDRATQAALVEHQAGALHVQNVHQATAIAEATKAQDLAHLNSALVPSLTQMQALDKNLATTHAGDPSAIATYTAGAKAIGDANWASFAQSSGLPQPVLDSLKPQFDAKVQEEMLNGASRLGDQQATYATTHLISTVAPTVDAAANAIASDPKLYGPAMAPGGPIEQSVAPLGSGEAHDVALAQAKTAATVNYVQGLIREKNYGLAQSELDSGKLDPYLKGDTKTQLENELASHGPAAGQDAAEAYTFSQTAQLDVENRAAEGSSIVTPAQTAEMQRVMSPEAFAKYQVDAHNADLVFQQIGGPISKQPLEALRAIQPPTDRADPQFLVKQAAYTAAQQQITERTKDPAKWVFGQDPGMGVKGGGRAGPGGSGSLGDRVAGELQGVLAQPGQVNTAAGQAYATDMLQTQQSSGIDANSRNMRMLPEAIATQQAESFEKAPPQGKYDAGLNLRAFIASFPSQLALAHGAVVSPRAMVARELLQAGMKQGDVAAIVDSTDSAAGKVAWGRYVAAVNDPELSKALEPGMGRQLYQAVAGAISKYQATSTSPADQQLNAGRQDQIYAQARYIMAKTGASAVGAAQQAAASLTDGFRFEGAMRMPLAQAQATYQNKTQPSMMDIAQTAAAAAIGAPGLGAASILRPAQSGWDAAHQGLAAARSWALGNGGANLSAPPGELAVGQSRAQYASIIDRSGVWTNIGDDVVALKVPRPDGQWETVTDKYGRPISMKFEQAIQDGQAGGTWLAHPPPPAAALSTPDGHPVHATTPAIGAAALAGSIAAHSQGQPPPPPPPPAPAANESGTQGSQNVPPGTVGTAGTAPAAAGMNATQRALAAVGASPAVLAMFGGADAAGPAAQAAPRGYEGLNVAPSKAVQLLLPQVIHRESGGDPAAHNAKSGAIGLMQLMPDTVKEWAPRLGLPVDLGRAQTDPAYNQAIGTALLNSLTQHYMKGAVPNAGIALALAAYDAGPGRVEGSTKNGVHTPGWLSTIGDPRSGSISTDEWISKIPFKETRDYVRAIMDRTTRRLAGVVGAGPPA
jgi:soluble lytic murein transglycosylase-like protein